MSKERINKARYWLGVLYPENMVDGWQEKVGDILQVPYAYCIHDSDHNTDGEDRKTHVHFILAFANTTTYKHALEIFRLLGEKAINKCEAAVNIRHAYNYLIHDTETCRKQGKHAYDPSARITGNNFDIGSYEQITQEEKNRLLEEMLAFAIDNCICDLATFYIVCELVRQPAYFDVFKSYGSLIERICKGNFLRSGGAITTSSPRESDSRVPGRCCPDCGSIEVVKNGKTAAQSQKWLCKECGKKFVD